MLPDVPRLLPKVKEEDNHCFGCGKANPIGLKLEFKREGEESHAVFTPGEVHQGWPGYVHGGVLSAVLDEALGYSVWPLGINCVTAKLNIRLKHMARVGEPLQVRSWVTRHSRKLIESSASISRADGTVIAEVDGLLYVVNVESKSQ